MCDGNTLHDSPSPPPQHTHNHADVQFWRSRKSLEGLSVRSVFFNVFQSFIVLLYILDNETNKIIIISVFVGEGLQTLAPLQSIFSPVVQWDQSVPPETGGSFKQAVLYGVRTSSSDHSGEVAAP